MNLNQDTLIALKDIVTDDFINSIENVFSIAIATSPLVLLNPKQYGKTTCGREQLMSVRVNFLS